MTPRGTTWGLIPIGVGAWVLGAALLWFVLAAETPAGRGART